MNITDIDLDKVYKFLKAGADLSTVLMALGISESEIPKIQLALENPADEWWAVFRSNVIRCRAQAKIYLIGKMFNEGGFAGAKYLLERMEQSVDNRLIENQKPEIENVAEIEESEVIDGEWDWNAN